MAITFRQAQPADLNKIVAIFNESVDLPVNDEVELITPASRQEWLASFNDDYPLWVAEDNRNVLAWCGLEPFYPHPAYRFSAEISIYVGQVAQHQGLGRRFLNFVDQQVQTSLPIKTVVAYIYQENQPSQKLFSSTGFTYWGTLHHIATLNDRPHDLLIYGRTYWQ